jgi:ABC-type transport system involved in cytochrome bd biosynthesis fused ATPase/permease subunit
VFVSALADSVKTAETGGQLQLSTKEENLDILVSKPLATASFALHQGVPLLLSGSSGCGKSALVSLLSSLVVRLLVMLHMHGQMDSGDCWRVLGVFLSVRLTILV